MLMLISDKRNAKNAIFDDLLIFLTMEKLIKAKIIPIIIGMILTVRGGDMKKKWEIEWRSKI